MIAGHVEGHLVVVAPLIRAGDHRTQRRLDLAIRQAAEPTELIGEDVLFEQQLGFIADVLPLAAPAATGAEMLADRVNAIRRGIEQLDALGDDVALGLLNRAGDHALAGDRVGDKDGLAAMEAHPRAAVGNRVDAEFKRVLLGHSGKWKASTASFTSRLGSSLT